MSTCAEAIALSDVRQSVAKLSEVELRHMSDASLLELARSLRPVVCQLQSAELRLIGAIDERRAAVGAGARSTAAWLRNDLRIAGAATRVKAARALAGMPRVAAAFVAGEISSEHVSVAARVSARLGDALPREADQRLADEARLLAPGRFAQAAASIGKEFITAETNPAPPPGSAQRWLLARHAGDGCVTIRGRFDAGTGTRLLAALDATADRGDSTAQRPLSVQRADALVRLCGVAGDEGISGHSSSGDQQNPGLEGEHAVPRSAVGHDRRPRVKGLAGHASGRHRRRRARR